MTVPLIVLAVLATVGGWVGLPEGFLWGDLSVRIWRRRWRRCRHGDAHPTGRHAERS